MRLKAPGGVRRAPLAVAAWLAASAVASAVAWLGVDSVLLPAAENPPTVLAAGAQAQTRTEARTVPSPLASPDAPAGGGSAGASAVAAPSHPAASAPADERPTASSPSPTPSPTSTLSRYETAGGVVVLAIGAHHVTLVSATPAAGYSVRNWSAAGWLRVDFSQGSTTYSVFATWNGYTPQVQIVGPSPSS